MTPERWQRLKRVFGEALERTGADRAAYVEQACAGDDAFQAEVENLLASEENSPGFLGSPTAPRDDTGVTGAAGESRPEVVPRRVGAYEFLRELGHGGMGTVYLAERVDEYLQKVAIKVIRRGMDTESVLARFRNERQILAALVHPNIAALLDGGTTDDGLPYFVMEYVEGEPIDRYCDARRLSTSQRLELFLAVCAAVQYAHANLVIHRDLKPSNVLVKHDGSPKLLDFGLAKVLGPGALALEQTATQLRFLTPAFASPEQLRGGPISTATDVYSLGVVLYRLLTGHRPYRTAGSSFEELSRAVCEEEPVKPSRIVLSRGKIPTEKEPADLEAVSAVREGTPQRLRRRLAGDLDTIILKAMEKDPDRRYISVEQFAGDVRRHLDGRPITARSGSAWYQLARFVARHRVGVTATALILLSLAGGLLETSRQRARAERERARAEERFSDVRKLADSFLFEFHDAIADLPGSTKARELVVKRAAEYLDRLTRDAQQDLALQRELAVAFQRLGEIQSGVGASLGNSRGAREAYGRALEIRRALAARPSAEAADIEELAHLEFALGGFFTSTGELPQAEDNIRSAAQRIETLIGSAAGTRDRRGMLAALYQRLGYLQARRGNERAALDSLQKSVSTGEAFSAAHPENANARGNLAIAANGLAERLWRAGNPQAALENSRKAKLIQEKLIQADPNNARRQRDLAETLVTEGDCLGALGKGRESLASYLRALELAEALRAADPRSRWDQVLVIQASRSLGTAQIKTGETRAGTERLRQAATAAERVVREDPDNAFTRNELALIYANLGSVLRESRAHGPPAIEGCDFLGRAVKLWDALRSEGRSYGEEDAELEHAATQLSRCPGPGGRKSDR